MVKMIEKSDYSRNINSEIRFILIIFKFVYYEWLTYKIKPYFYPFGYGKNTTFDELTYDIL